MGEAFVGHRANGKVYFISHDVLKAIDGNGDTLVPPTLEMGTVGNALCWNSVNDKLYWAGGESVAIVDCAADTVITAVGASAARLFYDSSSNRVFCSGLGVVTVIDGATNQVLLTIPAGAYPGEFAHSARQSRLYVPDVIGSSVTVIRTTVPGVADPSLVPRGHGHATPATAVSTLDQAVTSGEMVFDVAGRLLDAHRTRSSGNELVPGVYIVVPSPRKTPRKVVVAR
jgi:YVTN family beta-propeller protein